MVANSNDGKDEGEEKDKNEVEKEEDTQIRRYSHDHSDN